MKQISYPRNYIVWDLETSGLDPKADLILEFAAIEYKDGVEFKRDEFLINHPGFEVPEKITQITGITTEMCRNDGLPFEMALQMVYEILSRGLPHVTHNGLRFDVPFVLTALGRGGLPIGKHLDGLTGGEWSELEHMMYKQMMYKQMIDTAVLFKAGKLNMPRRYNESFSEWGNRVMETKAFGLKYNVGVCCDELNIPITTQHRALGDVLLTNEIYKKLTV